MTLDDAAERRISELARHIYRDGSMTAIKDDLRSAWTEATEAAAKKCEAVAELDPFGEYGRYDGAKDCAAAIRGKP